MSCAKKFSNYRNATTEALRENVQKLGADGGRIGMLALVARKYHAGVKLPSGSCAFILEAGTGVLLFARAVSKKLPMDGNIIY